MHSITDFQAGGSVQFGLKAEIGPIHLTAGGPDLGTINLDTGFDGGIDLSMHGGTFHGQVTGGFDFVGEHLTIPPLVLTVAPTSLADLPGLIRDLVTAQANAIFATFFQPGNVAKWLSAVAGKAIKDVGDVGIALRDHFHQDADSIGHALRDTLNLGQPGRREQPEEPRPLGRGSRRDTPLDWGMTSITCDPRCSGAGFSHAEVSHAPAGSLLIPHADAHGDVPGVIHADVHGDVPGVIHADWPHGDIPG